jgi:uncharacterized protein YcfL
MVRNRRDLQMKKCFLKANKIGGAMFFAICLIAAFSVSGCSTTGGIVATGQRTWNQDGAPELNRNIAIKNSRLAGNIEVSDIKSTMVGGLMKAQASLRSKSGDEVQIQYKFDWYDAQGMELGGNGAWKPFILYSKQDRTLQGVAPDPRVKEFKLEIREPASSEVD